MTFPVVLGLVVTLAYNLADPFFIALGLLVLCNPMAQDRSES